MPLWKKSTTSSIRNEVKAELKNNVCPYYSDVYSVFKKLLHPEVIKTDDNRFTMIKQENKIVHPAFGELLNHYIGNDINCINLILGIRKDSEEDLSVEDCQKILNYTKSMETFLAKLKKYTETTEEKIRNHLTLPMVYLRNIQENVSPEDKAKIDKCLASLEQIINLLK